MPVLVSYLLFSEIKDDIRSLIPVLTFITGQYLGKQSKDIELENRQKELLIKIQRKLNSNAETLQLNQKILEHRHTIKEEYFIDDILYLMDGISEEFSNFDNFFDLSGKQIIQPSQMNELKKISQKIKRYNKEIEERRAFMSKLRDLTNSEDQYRKLLKSCEDNLEKKAIVIQKDIKNIQAIKIIGSAKEVRIKARIKRKTVF